MVRVVRCIGAARVWCVAIRADKWSKPRVHCVVADGRDASLASTFARHLPASPPAILHVENRGISMAVTPAVIATK
jgi:hypothetical protein